MKLVIDHTIPYIKGIAEPFAEVRYLDSAQFTSVEIKEADALIVRSIDTCDRALLEGSNVKLITTATIGFDHIDTAYCQEAGITWQNAPGCNAVSVAQYVLASLVRVAMERRESLVGKTVGIVGVGHVGRQVERFCLAYGMQVLRNDPVRAEAAGEDGFVDLQTIAELSDIICFHTPLTRTGAHATHHLANKSFFDSLKRKPWFVNASRGGVHDTQALVEAIQTGAVGATILDCWEGEPNINRELLALTTLATPHIAGFSADGKANGTRACLEAVGRFFGVTVALIDNVQPAAPAQPTIDLRTFPSHGVERAILTAFDPLAIDAALRTSPEAFEYLRNHYDHPREYAAYTILHATEEQQKVLQAVDFRR
jgi:erythronate-4-phosphate dehydrogenase